MFKHECHVPSLLFPLSCNGYNRCELCSSLFGSASVKENTNGAKCLSNEKDFL